MMEYIRWKIFGITLYGRLSKPTAGPLSGPNLVEIVRPRLIGKISWWDWADGPTSKIYITFNGEPDNENKIELEKITKNEFEVAKILES